MARKEYSRQHFVPASYLRAWCDPGCPADQKPYVWEFDRDSRKGRKKAPHNILWERDFYTELDADGQRSLRIEHFLHRIETDFVRVRSNLVDLRRPLDRQARTCLCVFCATMHARTRVMRERVRTQWGRLLEFGEELEEWAQTATPEEREALQSPLARSQKVDTLDLNDLRRIVENPAQTAVRQHTGAEAELYSSMDLAVLHTDDRIGFITSDRPCIWLDPAVTDAPAAFRSPGLGSPTIEVLLPLSPNSLLLLNRTGLCGYMLAPEAVVDEANRMVRAWAERSYIVRRNSTRECWFSATPPT